MSSTKQSIAIDKVLFHFFVGCAGVIVGHPLDTVKVNLQTQDSRNPKYKGTLHCLTSLVRKEGIRGVYRGISSPLAGVAAINAVVFGVYGNTQRFLNNSDALAAHFAAGAIAGLSQSVLCSPMELAKTRIQITGDRIGPWQCLKRIHRKEGFRGVFRGIGATACREVPAYGSYFLTYEVLTRNSRPVSTVTMIFAGGFAGIVSWIITYPVDVLKSRIQADGMSGSPQYKNFVDCYQKSVKNEGYGFLVRGITPTVLRAFPTNAACFVVVTWSLRLLDGERSLLEKCGDALSNLKTTEVSPA